MSSVPVVGPADLRRARTGSRARPRVWVRTLSFAALALYGVSRWGELMRDPPSWRLLGLAALAVGLATVVPLVRHLAADRFRHAARLGAGALAAGLCLAALAVAGLRWTWVVHVRVAVCARAIGSGIGGLGDVLVPYLGRGYEIRLVMTLGAAVLLLDAGAALAFGGTGGEIGDGRRAAAALPLIALAVVPATLVPPASAPLQGLVLFLLLAAFLWGERIAGDAVAAAVGAACAAGIAGAIAAPLIAPAHAWVDYRAWAGGTGDAVTESFDWNQTYGPLRWPQDGRVVFTVHAAHGDYWKAEDLTDFTDGAWTAAPAGTTAPALPAPAPALVRRDTQTVTVSLDAIRTRDVIAGSGSSRRPRVPGGVRPGNAPGTWVADEELGPGDSYSVRTYTPTPSAARLTAAGGYPWPRLAPELTLGLPLAAGGTGVSGDTGVSGGTGGAGLSGGSADDAAVVFPGFHRPLPARLAREMAASPYAPAFALAHRLAAGAATPYAFVQAVRADLDGGDYVYTQTTASTRYPLLTFLFAGHRGYCQQFSGAMALLLRMGGVPARVAAGFTGGDGDPRTGRDAVSDLDAHAWDEVWFPRIGWVRFDPTPGGDPALGGRAGAAVPAGGPTALPAQRARTRAADRAAAAHPHEAAAHGGPRGTGARTAGRGVRRHDGGGAPGWLLAVAGLLAALALAAGARRLARRAGARVDPLAELERALARAGRRPPAGATLSEIERGLADAPRAAAYVRALREHRYAAAATPPPAGGRAALRGALGRGRGPAGRLRAWWALPPRPAR